MDFLYLIFYGCLRLRFLDVETNPGPPCPVPAVCRILCSNVRAWPGTLVTWPLLRLGMIYCFAVRLWSQVCVTCRRCWFLVSVALSCVGARCLGPWDGCIRSRWLRSISPTQIWVWLLRNAGVAAIVSLYECDWHELTYEGRMTNLLTMWKWYLLLQINKK